MLELPTVQAVNDVRIAKFKDQISDTLALGELGQFQSLIEDFERERNIPAIEIAAALAKMARGNVPLLLDKNKKETSSWSDDRPVRQDRFERPERPDRADRFERTERPERFERADQRSERPERFERSERPAFPKKDRVVRQADAGMQTFRIEVGHAHGVKPGNIVGAIANEAGLDSKNIGRIEIYDDYSVLDLPDNLPGDLLEQLKGVWVAGQQLRISRDGEVPAASTPSAAARPARTFGAEAAPRRERPEAPAPRQERSEPALPHAVAAPRKEFAAAAASPKESGDAAPARPKKDAKGKLSVTSYRIEVGHEHAVTPSNIVGAIANEAGLEAKHIGRIDIYDKYSVLDLPDGMPDDVLDHLKKVWVAGQQLHISLDDGSSPPPVGKKPAVKAKSDFAPRTFGADKSRPQRKGPGKA